ncbi:hypothetical protein KFU94_48360 [Chloroflexi bacterium TSY]|nr:hypothetical protein [Chloroflexi bacterium TSY]
MFGTHVTLEWVIGEERYLDIVQLPTSAEHSTRLGVKRQKKFLQLQKRAAIVTTRFVTIMLAMIVIATSGLFPLAERERSRSHAGIQRAHDLEHEAWLRTDRQFFVNLLDKEADSEWRIDTAKEWVYRLDHDVAPPTIELQEINVIGDIALVDTLIQYHEQNHPSRFSNLSPVGAKIYREVRFYRRDGERWLRTLPPNAFWGPLQEIQTPHLRFRFYAHDARLVTPLAAEMEEIFLAMHQAVGLEQPSTTRRLMLEFVPRALHGESFAGDWILISSPLMLSIPKEISNQTVIVDSLVSRFASRVLDDVRQPYGYWRKPLWRTLHAGVHSWLMLEVGHHAPVWSEDAEAVFQYRLTLQNPLMLDEIAYVRNTADEQREWYWHLKKGESMVQYATEQYGRNRLPALLEGLSTHQSWDDLIPSLYQISRQEFETGWNEYLNNYR